ncbi:hypothetical protein GCM10010517_25640 [Streptosporangium fragile]|uniref:Uncharacterized protein n=1 Tax=Streptosporangium fragile TaxID=46186 RepID=A0ABP6IBL5_9ACTN
MPRSIRGNPALARPYRDLVWLAYLALPPRGHDERRMALAHRMVTRAMLAGSGGVGAGGSGDTGRGEDGDGLDGLRREVLRRALRHRPWHLPVPGTRIEVIPAAVRGGDPAFGAALDRLPAPARAAYALSRLTGLAPEDVREVLAEGGVGEAVAAVAALAAVEERFGGYGAPSADPTVARVYGRLTAVRPRPLLVGAACLALLTGGWHALGLHGGSRPAGGEASGAAAPARPPHIRSVPPGTWRATTQLDLAAWEARGGLRGDRPLLDRALRAWAAPGPLRTRHLHRAPAGMPAADIQLLYAGEVDGVRVVLLRDPGRVARYTESGGVRSLEAFPEPKTVADAAAPLKLRTSPAGARYLLPPWVEEVSSAPLGHSSPSWRRIRVKDGVTSSVPASATPGCWRGPVLRLRAPAVAQGRPYTVVDLGSLALGVIRYEPPPPAPVRRAGPHHLDATTAGFAGWAHLGCALRRPRTEVHAATAWEFWAGALPEGARGRWMCARFTYADGTSASRAVLFVTTRRGTTALPTGGADDTWDCSRLRRDLVSGTWWRGPSGRWRYLAAGSRRVTRIRVTGAGVTGRLAPGPLVAVAGPVGGSAPASAVVLEGFDHHGRKVPVFQRQSGL